jgi:hypothetical protein
MFCEERMRGAAGMQPAKSKLNYVDELVCVTVLTLN